MYLVDFAAAIGLCTRTIGLAEANKLKVSPPSLRLLSDVLDVSDAYLGAFGNLPELTLGERIKKAPAKSFNDVAKFLCKLIKE